MLIYQRKTLDVLRRIVSKVTTDHALHEDLTQEAFIHLWMRESQCPGQTQSWYLQSCWFHLQNRLGHGRSIDSIGHRKWRIPFSETDDEGDNPWAATESADAALSEISARDILALLAPHLTPLANQILRGLADGLRPSEIAAELGVSHTCVIKHRHKMASLALKLGIAPAAKKTPGRPPADRWTPPEGPESARLFSPA